MEQQVDGVTIHYVEQGEGLPVVAFHGGGVDHRESRAWLEEVLPDGEFRRVYVDLPGMGRSTAVGLNGNDDVADVLASFVERIGEPVILVGHSYGGYHARGVAARRPEAVRAMVLVCPIGEETTEVPGQEAVAEDPAAYDELEPGQREDFDGYFVVRTPATARRYRDHVAPAGELMDDEAMARISGGWSIDVGASDFPGPVLIVAGRRDSSVGWVDAAALADLYPDSTLEIFEDGGHALMHEQPEQLRATLDRWLPAVRG